MRLRHHRGSRAWKEARANEPLEQHCLQLDGVADYGYAAVSGWTTGYALVVKIADRCVPVASTWSSVGALQDNDATVTDSICDQMIEKFTAAPDHTMAVRGFTDSGGANYSAGATVAVAARQVRSVSRDLAANTGKCRVVEADGTARMSYDYAAAQDRTPTRISIGAATTAALAGVATTYANMQWIGAVLLSRDPTNGELARWAAEMDARAIWGAGALLGYWPASLMYLDGATWKTRNLGSGTGKVPITWSGPTAADLVRLAA